MLTIETTPDLRILLDGSPIPGLSNTKGGAVVAYLALVGGAAPRSRVAGLLWSDLVEQDALNNLRFTLSQLRRQLPDVIEATRREVRLSDAVARRLDVDAIDAPEDRGLLDLRVEEFLSNFRPSNAAAFDEWATRMRDELGHRYLGRVATLAERLRSAGDADRAALAYRRWLALEPWSEACHRALAATFASVGDETGALAQLAACRETLRRELAVEPEPETLRLEAALRERRNAAAGSAAAEQTEAPRPAVVAPSGLDVGMEAERSRLRELVTSPAARIVTILGPGGAGKTHLARVVVGGLAPGFADGAAVVTLDDVDPQAAGGGSAIVLVRLAAALGVAPVPGQELKSIVEATRSKRRLVLIDNFEVASDAWSTLAALSEQAPGLKFIVTSRHQLGLPTEWVVRLQGLQWPPACPGWTDDCRDFPAVALLFGSAERLGLQLDPHSDGDAALRICAALEGWPLGLILAANWLQVYACHDIATMLENDATAMSEPPPPAQFASRHRSAAAVLDQSWALLDDDERAAFAAVCVFRGRFDAPAAAAVAGAAPATLAALIAKSLVRSETGGALSIHPMLREFGLLRLAETPARQEAVLAAHAARSSAALAAARAAFAAQGDPTAFDEAAAFVGDHRAVFRRQIEAAQAADADVLVEDLWLLHRVRGWIEDGAALMQAALAAPGLAPDSAARRRIWLSDAFFQLGRVDASAEAAFAALALLGERSEAGAGRAAIMEGLARVLLRAPRRGPEGTGATLAARAWNRIAQARFFDGDRDGFVAATLRSVTYRGAGALPATLASTALVLAYTPFARAAAAAARRAERTLGAADPFDRAWAHEQIALYRLGVDDLDTARGHALAGADTFRRLGQRRNWSECQALAAYAHFFAGRYRPARDEMRALRDDGALLREPSAELWGALGVLWADLMTGGPVEHYDAARAATLCLQTPDPNTELLLRGIQAWLAAREGRVDDAAEERRRFAHVFRTADMLSVYALNGFIADFMAVIEQCEAGRIDAAQSVPDALRRFGRFASTFPTASRYLQRAKRLWQTTRAHPGVAGAPGAAQRWQAS
jgi:DNA-binding SARP family transcriptional activator